MFRWEVSELEQYNSGFNSPEEAYKDASDFFENEGYEVGEFDGNGFTLYDEGNSQEGFLPFDGYCYIYNEEEK